MPRPRRLRRRCLVFRPPPTRPKQRAPKPPPLVSASRSRHAKWPASTRACARIGQMRSRVDSNICSMYDRAMKADVAVGFAADEQGNGVAYVRLGAGGERARLMRIAFTVKRYPALLEREIGYAALTAAS